MRGPNGQPSSGGSCWDSDFFSKASTSAHSNTCLRLKRTTTTSSEQNPDITLMLNVYQINPQSGFQICKTVLRKRIKICVIFRVYLTMSSERRRYPWRRSRTVDPACFSSYRWLALPLAALPAGPLVPSAESSASPERESATHTHTYTQLISNPHTADTPRGHTVKNETNES